MLPLTIDVTIDDSTPVFGLGLFFQPSLETTADDESDSDDEHYIGVIPPVRVAPALCCAALWFTTILQQ